MMMLWYIRVLQVRHLQHIYYTSHHRAFIQRWEDVQAPPQRHSCFPCVSMGKQNLLHQQGRVKRWEDSRWPIPCLGLTGLVIEKYVKTLRRSAFTCLHVTRWAPAAPSWSRQSVAPWTRRWCWSQAAPRASASAWPSGWPPTPTKHSKVTATVFYCSSRVRK